MRETARNLLRHYLTNDEIGDLHDIESEMFAPVELQRRAIEVRYLPMHPLKPGFGNRALTPEEQETYDKEVTEWRKVSGS